jgi:hypothetical protein
MDGDYASFDASVRRTVQLLTMGCGLRLRFFFDGPAASHVAVKASTATARTLQRREEWASLQG